MTYLFSCNIIPKAEPNTIPSNKIVNVICDTIPQALEKLNSAYPGCDIKSITKMQQVDLQ